MNKRPAKTSSLNLTEEVGVLHSLSCVAVPSKLLEIKRVSMAHVPFRCGSYSTMDARADLKTFADLTKN